MASVRQVVDPTKAPGEPGYLRVETDEKPHPLGATEVARALLHRIASAGGEHSSVEIARNAKGDYQFKVTVRTGEHEGIDTVEAAAGKAAEIVDTLRGLFPMTGALEA